MNCTARGRLMSGWTHYASAPLLAGEAPLNLDVRRTTSLSFEFEPKEVGGRLKS